MRSKGFSKLIKSEPVLLVHRAQFLRDAMRRARVAEDEVLAVLRGQGLESIGDVHAVVLEPDGSLSVLARSERQSPAVPVLRDVSATPSEAREES